MIAPHIATDICNSYFDLKTRMYDGYLEDEEVHYFTTPQLEELKSMYDVVMHDRTRDYKDLFLFSYYSCGLRYSDLLTLEWQHIDYGEKKLKKNLYKGKIPHTVPLMDGAWEILQRWKSRKLNSRFVFNLLPDDFNLNDAAALDLQRKSKNRSIQTSLKSIGMKMKLKPEFNLSIHVARHSFAVYALNRGLSLHMVSKLLGHSSITTTEKIYAKFTPETIENEVMAKLTENFSRC